MHSTQQMIVSHLFLMQKSAVEGSISEFDMLICELPKNCQIYAYHTPNTKGIMPANQRNWAHKVLTHFLLTDTSPISACFLNSTGKSIILPNKQPIFSVSFYACYPGIMRLWVQNHPSVSLDYYMTYNAFCKISDLYVKHRRTCGHLIAWYLFWRIPTFWVSKKCGFRWNVAAEYSNSRDYMSPKLHNYFEMMKIFLLKWRLLIILQQTTHLPDKNQHWEARYISFCLSFSLQFFKILNIML